MHILLTSGGTKTKIDSVRHVGNMSSGTFGCHLCWAFMERGHHVDFLHAEGSKVPHEVRLDLIDLKLQDRDPLRALASHERIFDKYNDEGLYNPISYVDFDEYARLLQTLLSPAYPRRDVVVLAAAVSDFAPIKTEGKISSDVNEVTIKMVQTPKLIRQIKKWSPSVMLVGFKLLVDSTAEQLDAAMREQKIKSGADMVVGNDLRDIRNSAHALTVMHLNNGISKFENMSGRDLARKLVAAVVGDYEGFGPIPF